MKKRTVLKDIALHVGVSTALVSYVLNNQEEEKRVGKDIAIRIRSAAKKLHYYPNHIAKSLKISKTHTIGLVVASINYHFTTGITSAIEAEARKNNYTVIFGSSDEDPQKFSEIINVLINRQVDGLILVAVENSQKKIEEVETRGIPYVMIDRIFPEIKTNYIGIDNYKAAYQSIVYLIERGHKRIGFINYKTSFFHLQERNKGYFHAIKDFKLDQTLNLHREVSKLTFLNDIKNSINGLIRGSPPCDAIFFATDTLALNGLKIINELKIKVPGEISIMSFDESEAFDLFYCSVTHARQPLEEMGKMAVKILEKVMDNKKYCKQIYLESTIVKGESCRES